MPCGVIAVVSVETYDVGGPARHGGMYSDYAAGRVRDHVRVVRVTGSTSHDDARVLEVYRV